MDGGIYVLNFYSAVFIDQLKRGRKTATIRLGDKSRKYKRGQIVWVTVGHPHSPREKIVAAMIDDVEVKRARELSPRDIEHDNPEFRRLDETTHFLEQIYGREIAPGWPRFWRRWAQVAGCAAAGVAPARALMFPRSWISFGVLHGIALMLIDRAPRAPLRRLAVAAGRCWRCCCRSSCSTRSSTRRCDELDRPRSRASRSPRTGCRCCPGWA